MTWSSVLRAIDDVRTGRLRVLCVGSARRLDSMPEVPIAAEPGVLPGYEAYSWVRLLAPAGTPAPVVARLNAEC